MSRWEDVQAGWDAGWRRSFEEAQSRYQALVVADPTTWKPRAEESVRNLRIMRGNLDRIIDLWKTMPLKESEVTRFTRLEALYYNLAAGVFAGSQAPTSVQGAVGFLPLLLPIGTLASQILQRGKAKREAEKAANGEVVVDAPEVGVAPAVVVLVLGIGLTVVGFACAVGWNRSITAGMQQTGLAVAELDARVLAMNTGKILQPTTLTPPAPTSLFPSPPSPPSLPNPTDYGKAALVVLAVLGVGGGIALYAKSR